MKNSKIIWMILIFVFVIGCKQEEEYEFKSESEYGQFAPPDAWEEDPNFAYYGSENEWTRRMFSDNAVAKFYKRKGQRQMLSIIDGNYEEAISLCKKTLLETPHDLESYFNLTAAFTQLNRLDSAIKYMNVALENGLPFTRFLAGPRELFQPLYSTKEFQKLKSEKNFKIVHGPMKGAVTSSSAKIWLRTVDESNIEIIVLYGGNEVGRYSGISEKKKDYVAVISVGNLQQDTEYNFKIVVDGTEIPGTHQLKTYAQSYRDNKIIVAFGGGAGYTDQHERIWLTLANYNLDAFLFLGDNVYVDLPEMPNAFHNYTYYRRQSRPEYRTFLETTNVYAIWDDHDAAIDDIWMGPYIDKPNWKLPMFRHFERQWVNPFNGTEDYPGCYFNFNIGEVEFFMMDTRFYRTNPYKNNRTMLGQVQKEWLKEKVLNSKARIKVLVSSVPWDFRAKPGSKDTWGGFETEREEIFSFLTENNIEGVILLSADRHRTDAWKIERENVYPLYEFQSSRLTNIHTHEIMPEALIAYNEKCSFGLLEFDFINERVVFDIVSIDNEKVGRLEIKFDELTNR